jgi:hypothetical protein
MTLCRDFRYRCGPPVILAWGFASSFLVSPLMVRFSSKTKIPTQSRRTFPLRFHAFSKKRGCVGVGLCVAPRMGNPRGLAHAWLHACASRVVAPRVGG